MRDKEKKLKVHTVGENNLKNRLFRLFIWLILLAGAIVMVFPLLWMLATSFRTSEEVYTAGISLIVKDFHPENYIKALNSFNFFVYLRNTVVVAGFSVVFMCLSSSLVAFGFAKYKAPGSNVLFMLLLATMMLPSQVTMIPRFVIMKNLGWLNTLYPLFVPSLFGSAFNVFLVRQFYMRLPANIDEAARIDGCGDFKIWLELYVPLSKPVLATVAIFEFMGKWNDFMDPLIYINSDKWKTLSLGLRGFMSDYTTQTNYLMAASLIVILPCLILFFLFQDQFMQGIVITGEK